MKTHEVKLGNLIPEDMDVGRDAIHIAVAPVIANETVYPGQDVALVDGENMLVGTTNRKKDLVGIVDPYLKEKVFKGQKFWLLLYPNTITSLRHEWLHPAFTASVAKQEVTDILVKRAVRWMEQFAREADLSYEEVMSAAKDAVEHNDYFVQRGSQSAQDTLSSYGPELFWSNYELITGTKVEDKERHFFSCSC